MSLRATRDIQERLRALDILVPEGLATFVVDENHPHWPEVAAFIREVNAVDIVSSLASDAELCRAAWLELLPTWHWSYPQPERDLGFLNVTYDLSNYCETCGMGAEQKSPFLMKGEPRWKGNDILKLNWVFDEYFVRPEAWAHVFEPFGIANVPVLHARTLTPLSTVVQLRIDLRTRLMIGGEHVYRHCARCERRKYRPIVRGCFPTPVGLPEKAAIVKSQEYFGDGARAFHAVLVSHDLWVRMRDCKLKGVSFVPACDLP